MSFSHEAAFYDGDDGYLDATMPFIREGLAAGEPVMVAVPTPRLRMLRDALGPDACHVELRDMTEIGANPARIIPAWARFVDDHAEAGCPMRGIGEPIWRDRSTTELVECQLHEALLNVAFAHAADFRLLCPYDAAGLDEAVVHEARCSHPVVHGVNGPCASAAYRAAGPSPAAEAPLPPPPSRTITRSFDGHAFADVRDAVARCGIEAGLDDVQLDGFILAIHELATNSVRHGGGIGVLRAWTEGPVAVCEIRDRGQVRDALAGRRAPRPEQLGGWGLWIANQVCDLVQIRSGADGTVVRARIRAA